MSASPTLTGTVTGAASNWSGNVGIGTTVPNTKLAIQPAVYTASTDGIEFQSSDNGINNIIQPIKAASGIMNLWLGANGYVNTSGSYSEFSASAASAGIDIRSDNGQIQFFTAGTGSAPAQVVTINSSGNVGIGTAVPSDPLEVYTNTNSSQGIDIQNVGTGSSAYTRTMMINNSGIAAGMLYSGSANTGYAGANGLAVGIFNASSGNLGFYTNNSAAMTIGSTGNVGIGTATPYLVSGTSNKIVHIQGSTNPILAIQNTTTGNEWGWYVDSSGYFNAFDAAATANRLSINTSGYVGIGVTSPLSNLQIQSATNKQIQLGSTAGTFTNSTYFTDLSSLDNTLNFSRSSDGGFTESVFSYSDGSLNNLGLVARGSIKFVTGAVANQGMIIKDSGNVGIGTTSPSAKMHIAANSSTNTVTGAGGNTSAILQNDDTTSRENDIIFQGGSSGGVTLNFSKSGTNYNSTGQILYSLASDYMAFNTAGNEKVRITSGGNVGIGMTSPVSILDISTANTPVYASSSMAANLGAVIRLINTDTTTNNAGKLIFSSYDSAAALQQFAAIGAVYTSHTAGAVSGDLTFQTKNAGTAAEVMRITGAGNVGIGVTSPTLKLSVSGPVGAPTSSGAPTAGVTRFQNTTLGNVMDIGLYSASPYGAWLQAYSSADSTVTNPLVLQPNGGNVGIGTPSPGQKLTVYGHMNTQGGLPALPAGQTMCYGVDGSASDTFGFCSSDRRLKDNIVLLDDTALSKISGLRPSHFIWKKTKVPMAGFIAQEVQKVIPEAVYMSKETKYYGLDTTAIVSYTVKAVQELKSMFDTDHNALAKLEADNDNLRARVEALEASRR